MVSVTIFIKYNIKVIKKKIYWPLMWSKRTAACFRADLLCYSQVSKKLSDVPAHKGLYTAFGVST